MRGEAKQRMDPTGGVLIGGVHDPAEKAADSLADDVMRAPAVAPAAHGMADDGEDEAGGRALRAAAPGGAVASGSASTRASPGASQAITSMGPGRPLADTERAGFEHRFGADLSGVRVHDDEAGDRASRSIDARAFTFGRDIGFASGEHQPGTAGGDRLMAHELAHSLQAGGRTRRETRVRRIPRTPTETPFTGEIKPWWSAELHKSASEQSDVLANLPRGHLVTVKGGTGWIEVETVFEGKALKGFISHELIRRHDQARGSVVPDVDQQAKIGAELDPSAFVPAPAPAKGSPPAAPAPVRVLWDGHSSNPDHLKNRADLKKDLLAGLKAFLAAEKPRVATAKGLTRVAMTQAGTGKLAGQDTGVQGIASAASNVLEKRYGVNMDAAVRTPDQLTKRSAPMNADPAAGAGQNLFDAYSKADRKQALGIATDAELAFGIAWWALQHDPHSAPHLKTHKLSPGWKPSPATEEWTFTKALLDGFVSQGTNEAELIDFRLFIANESTPKGIFLLTAINPATQGGDAAKAERAERWVIFSKAIHETVHFRTHPAFERADKGRGTMVEGFTEMFAKDAADPALKDARSGNAEPFRTSVEGTVAALNASLIPAQKEVSTQYIPDWNHAKAVRTMVGENAVRAAYFQGHVELLGLETSGADTPGLRAKGAAAEITKPPGVASLADLATATGLTEAQIKTANLGITDALLPKMVLPGCREHIVVGTRDASGASAVESRKQIATQNGVTEADLARANPGLGGAAAWPALAVGQRILIPKH